MYSRYVTKAGGIAWLLWFLCLLTSGATAQKPAQRPSRPRVILILCDALTIEDLRDPRYPALGNLARRGAIGLMNGATARPRTPTAAILTLALGQPQPAEASDELAYRGDEAAPDEPGSAAEVYTRRTDMALPAGDQIAHLGLASLVRRGLNGITLGAALAVAEPPVRAVVYGNADTDTPGRRAALLTLDRNGAGRGDPTLSQAMPALPFGRSDAVPALLAHVAASTDADLIVLQLSDTARAEAARSHLSAADYHRARERGLNELDRLLLTLQSEAATTDLIVVSAYPPADNTGRFWSRLTPILASGPHFAAGLLTSPTTRTVGLIANVDVAPTLLDLFQVDAPATMVGRAMRSVPYRDGPSRLAALVRVDSMANLNARAVTEVCVPLGGALFVLGLAGLIARRTRGPQTARRFAPVMVIAQNLPAALLLAPLPGPPTLPEYGLRIAGWMIALTGACTLLARPLRAAPPVAASLLLILLVMVDTLFGQPLVKDSLLSAYALSGIRYYGVGNEYLGALLGMALAGGFAWLDDLHSPSPSPSAPSSPTPLSTLNAQRSTLSSPTPNAQRPTPSSVFPLPLLLLWLLLALDLGWPGLGANAGSVIVTAAGFGVGGAILRGKRPTVGLALACTLLGLALSFSLGALDVVMAGRNSSHAGAALSAAAHGRGAGYLAQIALRKLAMNLRLLFSPYLLLGAGVVAAMLVAARASIGSEITATLSRRPWTARSQPALLAAIAASLLIKDSGVVTATFTIGSAAVILLWYVLDGT